MLGARWPAGQPLNWRSVPEIRASYLAAADVAVLRALSRAGRAPPTIAAF
jgi:hypothetical protein